MIMRRDSIFYQLFQQSPSLLFELLNTAPPNATNYRFDSVAVKEPTFTVDGVFLPPDTGEPGVVFLCEVQFQKDDRLYERLFGEAFLYFYRNRDRFSDWQAVIIYPSRSIEQSNIEPYLPLLESPKVHRIFLNELGNIRQLPLGVALMVLTTLKDDEAAMESRALVNRSQASGETPQQNRAIIDMIATIMVYKFTNLSRQEVEQMLGINLQETRVYREAKAEGEEIGVQRERSLVLRQLTRRVGELPQILRSPLDSLSLDQLEALGEALLDFSTIAPRF